MTGRSIALAVLAAWSVALLVPARSRVRSRDPRSPGRDDRALLLRWRPVLAGLALIGAWTFVTGVAGIVVGVVVAVVAWRVLGRTESPAVRRRRDELARDLPTAVHLLASCLAAGAATTTALDAVAEALPGAVADELDLVRRRLALGVGPVTVWQELAGHPQLGPLGRSFARAHRSGAPVGAAVTSLADELTARTRARTDELARSVEVRAAAPLGVCFLPAFLALGVVPMVVGVFAGMRLFG